MMKKTKSLNKIKSEYYKLIFTMDEKISPEENIMLLKKRILESLEDVEIKESKAIFFDKKANQFSIKIPKSIALRAGLDENSVFDFVLKNKKNETLDEIKESKLAIFLKEDKNGKEKDKAK